MKSLLKMVVQVMSDKKKKKRIFLNSKFEYCHGLSQVDGKIVTFRIVLNHEYLDKCLDNTCPQNVSSG